MTVMPRECLFAAATVFILLTELYTAVREIRLTFGIP